MVYDIAACMGLPLQCYVFPLYENACAASDLCALPAVRVANSLRAAQALVSLCALASSILRIEKSPAVGACWTQRSLHSFICPTTPPLSCAFWPRIVLW